MLDFDSLPTEPCRLKDNSRQIMNWTLWQWICIYETRVFATCCEIFQI